jgi:hypothetical protein
MVVMLIPIIMLHKLDIMDNLLLIYIKYLVNYMIKIKKYLLIPGIFVRMKDLMMLQILTNL